MNETKIEPSELQQRHQIEMIEEEEKKKKRRQQRSQTRHTTFTMIANVIVCVIEQVEMKIGEMCSNKYDVIQLKAH